MTTNSRFSMEGGCACKHVRYRMEAKPLIVHCCHCYCELSNKQFITGLTNHRVPTRNWLRVCPQCHYRGLQCHASRRLSGPYWDPVWKRRRPSHSALPEMLRCCLESLQCWSCDMLSKGWNAWQSIRSGTRCTYLYWQQIAMGAIAGRGEELWGILWDWGCLVEGEFRKEEIIFAGSVEVEGGAEVSGSKLMGLLEGRDGPDIVWRGI